MALFLFSLANLYNGFGQPDAGERNVYRITGSREYGLHSGLPDQCVSQAFIDFEGRLNIAPCPFAQRSYDVHLYQFDGLQPASRQVRLQGDVVALRWISPAAVDTTVFALVFDARRDTWPARGVLGYNLFSGETAYYPIIHDGVELEVIQMVRLPGQQAFLVAARGKAGYYFLRWKPDRTDFIVRVDDPSFTLHDRSGILELEEGLIVKQPTSCTWIQKRTGRVRNIPFPLSDKRVLSIDIPMQLPSGEVLIPDSRAQKLYSFDGHSLRPWKPVSGRGAPGRDDVCAAFRDYTGNILILCQSMDGHGFAELYDARGQVLDYSGVFNSLPEKIRQHLLAPALIPGLSDGTDFTQTFLVTGPAFTVVDLAPGNRIHAFPIGRVRGMGDMGSGSVLFPRHGILDMDTYTFQQDPDRCFEADLDGDVVRLGDYMFLEGMPPQGIIEYHLPSGTCRSILEARGISHRMFPRGDSLIIVDDDNRLYTYHPASGTTRDWLDDPVAGEVSSLVFTRDDAAWVGTSKGLFRMDRTGKRLEPVPDLAGYAVLCLYEDQAGLLWVGTFGYGLILFDPRAGKTLSVEDANFTGSSTVAAIVEDDDGHVWVGTFNGISIFTQDFRQVGRIYAADGLVDSECNRWACLKTSNGQLLFGSPKGVSVIDPRVVNRNLSAGQPRRIYISRLVYGDTSASIGSAAHALLRNGLVLPANNRNIRLQLGISNYASQEDNTYEIKVEGRDAEWKRIGSSQAPAIDNLPAGRYTVRIRGVDHRGIPTANELVIPVFARQFFFKTPVFYTLCILAALAFGISWVHRQRTKRRRLEEEVARRTETINEQTEKLRRLDQAKTRLYTNITHEFRTPLTVIRGLSDRPYLDSEGTRMIRRNAGNILHLVNQMLDLRKLESGNLQLQPIQSDLIRFLSYLGESIRPLAIQKNLAYHFLAPNEPLYMDFDPEKLNRIVSNILSNAIKFTPEGGNVYMRVEGPDEPGNRVHIKITDTGTGIPAAEIGHIFEQFYQAENLHGRQNEGTGIGLTLAQELVRLMQGQILVESRVGLGTTFDIELPVTRQAPLQDPALREVSLPDLATPEPAAPGASTLIDEPDLSGAPLVLIVEDNSDVLHYLGSCLRHHYRISVAMDGEEGIAKAIEEVPDLIISDVMMPGVDGFELCHQVKSDIRTSHVPIILLTAKADLDSRLQGLRRGADIYLEKPFHEQELLAYMRNAIALRNNLRERYGHPGPLAHSPDPDLHLEDEFIIKFRRILDEHMEDEDWGISDMYTSLHISRTQLHNKIKALTGKSTSQYMRSLRLHAACQILSRGGDLTIAEVAYQVGFGDPKYFTRVFKEEYGMTPSDWVTSAK